MQNVLIQLTLHLNLVQIKASFENNVPNFLILYVEIKIIINKYNTCTMITWASLLFTDFFIKYDVYTVLTPTIYVLWINIGRN